MCSVKMRSVENAECEKCALWKMRSVEWSGVLLPPGGGALHYIGHIGMPGPKG